jgi:hypothetical protein
LDVLSKHLLHEVRFNKLMLQGMLIVLEQILIGVQSNLILLHISINKDHAFNLVVDAVPDEVVLKDKLFSKDKSEISFRK